MAALEKTTLGLGRQPALLVVDASSAFTDPESPLGGDFRNEIGAIKELIGVAGQRGWPKFFSTVWFETDAEATVFREKVPALNLLVEGSSAVAIDDRLPVTPSDQVFRKTHASCFFATGLDAWLRRAGVDSLVIAGFTTSGCVRATVVDSLQYNYRTVVVREAVGDREWAAHLANLYDIEAKYGDVCALKDL